MSNNKFPLGWDEDKVKKVLAHYESQSETEAIAEDEAVFEEPSDTVMKIPAGLLPTVRELLGKYQSQDANG